MLFWYTNFQKSSHHGRGTPPSPPPPPVDRRVRKLKRGERRGLVYAITHNLHLIMTFNVQKMTCWYTNIEKSPYRGRGQTPFALAPLLKDPGYATLLDSEQYNFKNKTLGHTFPLQLLSNSSMHYMYRRTFFIRVVGWKMSCTAANWHALNSTFPNTNCIVSFQINPHWISNSGHWKEVLKTFRKRPGKLT